MNTVQLRQKWRPLLAIGLIFAMSRALIAFVAWGSDLVLAKGRSYHNPASLLDLFYRWDSHWYMSIIDRGYYCIPGKHCNVNFFPLYPMLVKLLSLTGIHPQVAGFLISNACLLIAAIYLFKLARLDYAQPLAVRAAAFLLISPVSFFFSMIYTESLFIVLAIAAFYYARKGRWALVGILGAFLTATRGVGVLIVVPLVVEYFAQRRAEAKVEAIASAGETPAARLKWYDFGLRRVRPNFLWLGLVPCGLLAYMTYLYVRFHNPMAFVDSQGTWGRTWSSILYTLQYNAGQRPFFREFFFGAATIGAALTLYMMYKRMRLSYIVLCLVYQVLYLSTIQMESLARYLSVLFPLYIALALAARRRTANVILVCASMCLLTLCTILLVNGYWMT